MRRSTISRAISMICVTICAAVGCVVGASSTNALWNGSGPFSSVVISHGDLDVTMNASVIAHAIYASRTVTSPDVVAHPVVPTSGTWINAGEQDVSSWAVAAMNPVFTGEPGLTQSGTLVSPARDPQTWSGSFTLTGDNIQAITRLTFDTDLARSIMAPLTQRVVMRIAKQGVDMDEANIASQTGNSSLLACVVGGGAITAKDIVANPDSGRCMTTWTNPATGSQEQIPYVFTQGVYQFEVAYLDILSIGDTQSGDQAQCATSADYSACSFSLDTDPLVATGQVSSLPPAAQIAPSVVLEQVRVPLEQEGV